MKRLPNSAFQLEKSRGANGYVITAGEQLALIDPGMASGAAAVVRELQDAGLLPALRHVLLTHYDPDHAGAARAVAKAAGATLWISRADAAVLRGQSRPATLSRRVLTSFARPRLPGQVSYLGESEGFPSQITAMASSGHTAGHYAFLWQDSLFCGDAAMVRADGTLKQFPSFLIANKATALQTAAELEAVDASWICPGHGKVTRKR